MLFLGLSLTTFGAYGQTSVNTGVVSMAGAELGLRTGVFYEQRLARSFSLLGSVGYEVNLGATFHSGFSYTGVKPVVAIAPRWYFNIPENNMRNDAPYITLEASYSTETGGFLLPKDKLKREKWDVTTLLAFGYRRSLSEKFMLKGQAGLSLTYTKLYEEKGFFDKKDWESKNELVFDLGIIYKF